MPYIQYLLPGSITMSIFMMVMIGGGIIFIDDKARGLHEGYLVTPITKLELVAGFNLSGTIKAVLAGAVITVIGSLIAGVPNPLDPMRLLRMLLVITFTAFALISLMFLLMVRVTDPLMPRAMFGVLNTVLYFPSGAVYPQQGFPGWMQAIAVVDPFTYSVHAFKSLLLKNTGFDAIAYDLLFLRVFSAVAMTAATAALQANPVMQEHDNETRERLLSTAERLFAERGFSKVTIREICRSARANVAAVNYHFNGKTVSTTKSSAPRSRRCSRRPTRFEQPGPAALPEEQLAAYISIFLKRVVAAARQLDPPADDAGAVRSDAGARPGDEEGRAAAHGVPARGHRLDVRLRADDARVERCVMSVQAQCLALLTHPVAALRPKSMTARSST